jgi:hypothetical protein
MDLPPVWESPIKVQEGVGASQRWDPLRSEGALVELKRSDRGIRRLWPWIVIGFSRRGDAADN